MHALPWANLSLEVPDSFGKSPQKKKKKEGSTLETDNKYTVYHNSKLYFSRHLLIKERYTTTKLLNKKGLLTKKELKNGNFGEEKYLVNVNGTCKKSSENLSPEDVKRYRMLLLALSLH